MCSQSETELKGTGDRFRFDFGGLGDASPRVAICEADRCLLGERSSFCLSHGFDTLTDLDGSEASTIALSGKDSSDSPQKTPVTPDSSSIKQDGPISRTGGVTSSLLFFPTSDFFFFLEIFLRL